MAISQVLCESAQEVVVVGGNVMHMYTRGGDNIVVDWTKTFGEGVVKLSLNLISDDTEMYYNPKLAVL